MNRRPPPGAAADRGRGAGGGVGADLPGGRRCSRASSCSVDARFAIRGAQDAAAGRRDRRDRRQDALGGDGKLSDQPRRHAKVIEQLAKAGASVIAYDVQFTEPARPGRRQGAARGGARRATRRARYDRGRADGSTAIFGGGEGAQVQRRDARDTRYRRTTTTAASGACSSRSAGSRPSRSRPRGSQRGQARAPAGQRAPGSTSRACRDGPAMSFVDVERGNLDRRGAREGRGRRRDRARAQDLHRRRRSGDALCRAGDPGRGDRHRAGRLPAATMAGWVDGAAGDNAAGPSIAPLVAMRLGTAVALIVGVHRRRRLPGGRSARVQRGHDRHDRPAAGRTRSSSLVGAIAVATDRVAGSTRCSTA